MSTGPGNWLTRLGLHLSDFSERYFPDALVFALLGIVLVFLIGLGLGEAPATLAEQGGKAFWTLVPFTMQMVMVVIGGYVVATAPLTYRLIVQLARLPRTPRTAIGAIALFSLLTSLLSWGFSLVFSALLTRELARRVPGMDYRAAGAAAYLGLGAVWALGLSSSAALMMATPSALPPALKAISGLIPLTETLFLWQSVALAAILILVSVAVAVLSAPRPGQARTAVQFGIVLAPPDLGVPPRTRPGDWLEHAPLLNVAVAALLGVYLIEVFRHAPLGALAALDLNNYNLIFLSLGLLLQWRPRRFLKAVSEALPATGGVIIQFPFYAVIFGMISGSGISHWLASGFARVTTPGDYPVLVAAYSALLGVFVPSGGSKWVVEAPYVLEAAKLQHVHLGWVVQIYNAAEALPNLVNPFWMLPLAAMLRLKPQDLIGYGMLQLMVHLPIVVFLCWLFARTLPYVPAAP